MNKIELEDINGLTQLKINGTIISFIKGYTISRNIDNKKDLLELSITISADPNKSKIQLD